MSLHYEELAAEVANGEHRDGWCICGHHYSTHEYPDGACGAPEFDEDCGCPFYEEAM